MVARSTPPSVLVADAEPYICRVFEARLSKNDQFQVETAASGPEALRHAEERAFDVLLWDMRLRNTPDYLPRLRALCPDAALLIMTTDDRPVFSADLERLDIVQALTKPFGLDTLVERVQAALDAPRPVLGAGRVELTHIGQHLLLIGSDGDCATRVLSSAQDSFAVVAAPRVAAPDSFAPGTRLRVQVQGQDARYSFATRLLRAYADPVPAWELQMPRVIVREQRRRYPRHPLRLLATLTPDTNLPQTAPSESVVSGTVDDISLSGCAVWSEQKISVGATVSLAIRADAEPGLAGQGRIVRIQPLVPQPQDTLSTPRYRIAVEFTELNAVTRRRLRSLLESFAARH